MTPKFRISNIVPNVPKNEVLVWYVWDNGQIDTMKWTIEEATLQNFMEWGFERQAFLDAREAEIAEMLKTGEEASGDNSI